MLDCSLDTRYRISGRAWRAIQLKLPTTLLNCFSSPFVTRSAGFLCLAISMYVVFLVLSATSRRISCPATSNCLPQNLIRPFSFLPTSNLVRRRSTTACPVSVHAHKKSSTCVVRTTSTHRSLHGSRTLEKCGCLAVRLPWHRGPPSSRIHGHCHRVHTQVL